MCVVKLQIVNTIDFGDKKFEERYWQNDIYNSFEISVYCLIYENIWEQGLAVPYGNILPATVPKKIAITVIFGINQQSRQPNAPEATGHGNETRIRVFDERASCKTYKINTSLPIFFFGNQWRIYMQTRNPVCWLILHQRKRNIV